MGRPPTSAEQSRSHAARVSSLRIVASPRVEQRGAGAASEAESTEVGVGAMERFLCEECGDVIGVYEPLVICIGQNPRITSRATEPELRASNGAYYHRECHTTTTP